MHVESENQNTKGRVETKDIPFLFLNKMMQESSIYEED